MAEKGLKKPKWLEEWRRRTRIINIMELAFNCGCDCEVCKALRQLAQEMEGMMPPTTPQVPSLSGGESLRRKRRRKK
ncbi:hypothetical protein DRO59_09820 [Candidatus Bathyarchaeota archaeon]|nr:MAG: hypothetical protein DRO59_09820 [Candidatus Bathyarchaeota archaeon]